MSFSGVLQRVALVRTDVSVERSVSITMATTFGELETTLAVTVTRCEELLTLIPSPQFLPWWWRRYVPPKCRYLQEPHGVTSQNTPFLIATEFVSKRVVPCNLFTKRSVVSLGVKKDYSSFHYVDNSRMQSSSRRVAHCRDVTPCNVTASLGTVALPNKHVRPLGTYCYILKQELRMF
jgi:hypothetical protein